MYNQSWFIPTTNIQVISIGNVNVNAPYSALPSPYFPYYDQQEGDWIDDITPFTTDPAPTNMEYLDLNTNEIVNVDSVSYLVGTRPQKPR